MSGERPKFVADVEPLKTFAVSVDLSLRPGTYVVLVRGCMPSRGSRHCYLSWYGSDDVDMGLVPSKGERFPCPGPATMHVLTLHCCPPGLKSLLVKAWQDVAWRKGTPLDHGGVPGLSGKRVAFKTGMVLVYKNTSDKHESQVYVAAAAAALTPCQHPCCC